LEKAEVIKKRSALFSVLAAFSLVTAKLIIGLITGSLGILSEAAHSGLDVIASTLTFIAIKISAKPPDKEHHYGHGKIENVAALVESIFLFMICVWILYEAGNRIINKETDINVNIWAFGVMVFSIVVDLSRFRVLKKTAEKYQSAALKADALHFFSDMLTSSTVLIGLVLVKVGIVIGDSIASIIVALYIIKLSYKLAKDTIYSLMDTAPKKIFEKVKKVIDEFPDIIGSKNLRVRTVGNKVFIDVNVLVDRQKSFEKSHLITDNLENSISKKIKNADIVVHTEPAERKDENIRGKINAIIAKHEVGIHDLFIKKVYDKYDIDLDMEFAHDTIFNDAFEKAESIKKDIYDKIDSIGQINIHIEDKYDDVKISEEVSDRYPDLIKKAQKTLDSFPKISNYHNLRIYNVDDKLKLTTHCEFKDEVTVREIHNKVTEVEKIIKEKLKEIDYIVIQPEPKK